MAAAASVGGDPHKAYRKAVSKDPSFMPCYIVAEKILMPGEDVPKPWPIFSTTGYMFMNSVNGIFVDQRGAHPLTDYYRRKVRGSTDYASLTIGKKKLVMEMAMSGEVNTLGHYLSEIAERNRHTRDFTLNDLIDAIIETIACFPVYRTYTNSSEVSARDRRNIEQAIACARGRTASMSSTVLDFLRQVLLLEFPSGMEDQERQKWLDFVMRFQQLTGPVMAKGMEDTACYVFNRLVSLNEVGGSPERFGSIIEEFHDINRKRRQNWPHALIATSTHDSKRGEDVRARINVLSELPDQWGERVSRWMRLNRKHKSMVDGVHAPSVNEEYLFYQSILGAWPMQADLTLEGREEFSRRIGDYMLKALREAKVTSNWISPNTQYEGAVEKFVRAVLLDAGKSPFMSDFIEFQRIVARYGVFNSLSQALLKITSPGVPDLYQGAELWDLNLVDPDNRRPVDFGLRAGMLEEITRREAEAGPLSMASESISAPEDGRVKLYLVRKALGLRKREMGIFEKGSYEPLDATGERARNVCAFLRQNGDRAVVVIAPRFFTELSKDGSLPVGEEAWGASKVEGQLPTGKYVNELTGEEVFARQSEGKAAIALSDAIKSFPVALLIHKP
jgi:(1->4)-alpha-D-glucan 1-alpha-D-glucosylmutase